MSIITSIKLLKNMKLKEIDHAPSMVPAQSKDSVLATRSRVTTVVME